MWFRRRETRRQVGWEDGFSGGGGYIVEVSGGFGEWEALHDLHTIYTLGLICLGLLVIVAGIDTKAQFDLTIRVSDWATHHAFLQGVTHIITHLHINIMGTTTFDTSVPRR